MSEAPEADFGEVKPRKKAAKKQGKSRKAAAPARAVSAEPFPGLTRTACADGCGHKGCVISDNVYCAHPTKGGLQSSDMNNPEALKRMQRARDQLQVRIDPDRFK